MTEINLAELQTTVRTLRLAAQGRIEDDRARLFAHVSEHDFRAIIEAVGEISVFEARSALARLEAEGAARDPQTGETP